MPRSTRSRGPSSAIEDRTLVERLSGIVCCGKSSHLGIAIYAPVDFLFCLVFFLTVVSLMPYKFLTESEASKYKLFNLSQSKFRGSRISKYTVPGHIINPRDEKHAQAVNEKCKLTYIVVTPSAAKTSHLQTWLSLIVVGQLLFIGGSIPLFRIRGGDIHHSHEGKALCRIFFIFQPLAAIFVFIGLHQMTFDDKLCEIDLLFNFDFCCRNSRLVMYYSYLISLCTYKFHQIIVVVLYYLEVDTQLLRHEQFRRKVVQSRIGVSDRRHNTIITAPDASRADPKSVSPPGPPAVGNYKNSVSTL